MTFDKIRELLAQQFEVSADSISMETNIVDDLGGDSLDVVDLIIPDEDAVELSTVGKIVEYIEKQQ